MPDLRSNLKTIDTLKGDIYDVLRQKGGWSAALSTSFGEDVRDLATSKFMNRQDDRSDLRMSILGTKCETKLWSMVNEPIIGDRLAPNLRLKFFYGDMIEALVIRLAIASGHSVTGLQDELEIAGVKGHRDVIIDGMLCDVKSCSDFAFNKFMQNKLREDDPFGYIEQISSYLYASQNDPLVVVKDEVAFVAVNKVTGDICIDRYKFDLVELERKKGFVEDRKRLVSGPKPTTRLDPVPQYKDKPDGNLKLGTDCSYCEFKERCWPEMRVFHYSNKDEYLVRVVNEPRVPEAKEDLPNF